MCAWSVANVGEPRDVLRLIDCSVPSPGAGQVLIRVVLAAMNFPDHLMIRGLYQVKPQLPFTPGHEVLGRVVAVGSDVECPLAARVIALTAWPSGGFAEYALADAADLFEIPEDIGDEDAASLLITYQTSYVALHRRSRLQPGEVLLVHAGAGGVGSAAIELGVAVGARVISTAGSDEKLAVCLKLGAEHAINYRTDDFVERVRELTGGRGADVIYDPVGGDVFDQSRRCIAWEGRILIIGFAGGRIAELPTNHALLKNYSVVGVHWGAYREHDRRVMCDAHEQLIRLYRENRLHPVVDRVFPLVEMPDALDQLLNRQTVGRVLVRP
jgi:NADPH2:quinone reductase